MSCLGLLIMQYWMQCIDSFTFIPFDLRATRLYARGLSRICAFRGGGLSRAPELMQCGHVTTSSGNNDIGAVETSDWVVCVHQRKYSTFNYILEKKTLTCLLGISTHEAVMAHTRSSHGGAGGKWQITAPPDVVVVLVVHN